MASAGITFLRVHFTLESLMHEMIASLLGIGLNASSVNYLPYISLDSIDYKIEVLVIGKKLGHFYKGK